MLLKFVIIFSLVYFSTAIVNENDVSFRFFTRGSPLIYTILTLSNLENININVSIPFKFVTHGYFSNADTAWMLQMKDSYLKKIECNVVLIDWSTVASELYENSAAVTKDIGKYLGDLIIALNTMKGNSYLNVHLIGHSLGAHVCGFAGKHVINTVSEQIWRISAMDAAGPLFSGAPSDQRLSVGDAIFIDAVHTDDYKFGYADPIGNVDFYPNGGVCPHTGCLTRRKRDLTDTMSVSCCHSMAHIFTNEAINSNRFASTKCVSYNNYILGLCRNNNKTSMGENVDINAFGTYYLITNLQSPYARG